MTVRIALRLDDDQLRFQAGSQIVGTVHIEISSASFAVQESFQQVDLAWTCSSDLRFEHNVRLTTSDPVTRKFKSTAVLFHHPHLLTERRFLPAASQRGEDGGTIIFPFRVIVPAFAEPIPTGTASSASESDIYPPNGFWPGSANYCLRAGSQYPPQNLPSSSDESFSYPSGPVVRFEGSINYTLHASVPGVKNSATQSIAVVNRMPRPDAALDQWTGRKFESKVQYMDSDNQQTPLWKRPFSKHLFRHVGMSMDFESRSMLALNARDDECLPFRMRVQLQAPASEASDSEPMTMPKFFLTRLCVSIKGRVAARPNPSQNTEYLPRSADGLDERTIIDWKRGSKRENHNEIPLDTFWDVASHFEFTYDLLNSKVLGKSQANRTSKPMDLIPDFCLPNLVRNYSLAWKMTLACGGTEVDWTCGAGSDSGLPVMLRDFEDTAGVDEQLPAYEAA